MGIIKPSKKWKDYIKYTDEFINYNFDNLKYTHSNCFSASNEAINCKIKF